MGTYVAVLKDDLIAVHHKSRNGYVAAEGLGLEVREGTVSWDTGDPNTLTIKGAPSPKERRGKIVFPERSGGFGL